MTSDRVAELHAPARRLNQNPATKPHHRKPPAVRPAGASPRRPGRLRPGKSRGPHRGNPRLAGRLRAPVVPNPQQLRRQRAPASAGVGPPRLQRMTTNPSPPRFRRPSDAFLRARPPVVGTGIAIGIGTMGTGHRSPPGRMCRMPRRAIATGRFPERSLRCTSAKKIPGWAWLTWRT